MSGVDGDKKFGVVDSASTCINWDGMDSAFIRKKAKHTERERERREIERGR